MTYEPVLVESGVDYLTLTSNKDGIVSRETYERLKEIHVDRDWGGQAGIEESVWRWNGYAGKRFGKLLWGCRPDGSIIRVSSSAADTIGKAMSGTGWNCTRVDFQATVRLSGTTVDAHIKDCATSAVLARSAATGRPVKIAHINGYGAGDTLNIGSRSSDVYMRVYNKARESELPEYEQCVRVECEFKDDRARNAYWAWQASGCSHDFVLETLAAMAGRRGVSTLHGVAKGVGVIPLGRVHNTNLDAKLMWLEHVVRPSVDKLVAAGWKEDVLRALGLDKDNDLPVAQRVLL